MKKLFIILTILANTFLLKNVQAFDCASAAPKPQIDFYTSYGKLTYDLTKSQHEITAIAKKSGILEKGLFASGLATIQVAWEINVNTLSERISQNEICVFPKSLEIFIGYQNPVIYLEKNLKPNSCQYNLVMRHEQTHQQINKTALEHFLPLFYKQIIKIAGQMPPEKVEKVSEINKATERLSQNYTRQITPLIDFFKKQLLAEQYKLDNKSNYIHEAELCRR